MVEVSDLVKKLLLIYYQMVISLMIVFSILKLMLLDLLKELLLLEILKALHLNKLY